MSCNPLGHDWELEPSDDAIAALQHQVACARQCHAECDVEALRSWVLTAFGADDFWHGKPLKRLSASEWLAVAGAAMQAFEAERAAEEEARR